MKRTMKTITLGVLLTTSGMYAASVAQCASCHGQHFEKVAMGTSKIVKDMRLHEIVDTLKGYRDGTYGGALKGVMRQQVKDLDDKYIESMAQLIKSGTGVKSDESSSFAEAAQVAKKATHINMNIASSDPKRIAAEELGSKKEIAEKDFGLRKTDLYDETDAEGDKTDYTRPAPGTSTKFERAFKDAPPMIPHSVDGLLPITRNNNQCVGCHMPDIAPAIGATPIPASHFTNYRPSTMMKEGMVLKEGQVLGSTMANTADIKIAQAKKSDTLYQGRFSCTQCHAPQSNTKTDVANTFKADFGKEGSREHSSLADAMNEGVDFEVEDKTPFIEGK